MSRLVVVTGAFGYTGRHVTERLLSRGDRIRTLTNKPASASPFGDRVERVPYRLDDPSELTRSLSGADALVNTYWVRFERGETTYAGAVENTRRLFTAARQARVRRVVHVSITNPDESSELPYFAGKAAIERSLEGSGISHAIVRPTVLFGGGRDILVNNIAWFLRKLPVFGVPGFGRYPIQPVHVGDLADLLVGETLEERNRTVDAVGPETFRFVDLVRLVRDAIGVRAAVIPCPGGLVWVMGRIAGACTGDVVLTRSEIRGLAEGLLVSGTTSTLPMRFTDWLQRHSRDLGREYASELERHFR